MEISKMLPRTLGGMRSVSSVQLIVKGRRISSPVMGRTANRVDSTALNDEEPMNTKSSGMSFNQRSLSVMRKRLQDKRASRGVTLVEVLIVVAIIAMVA